MKIDLDNLNKQANKISLSGEEKSAMFNSLRQYTNQNPIKTGYYSIFFRHTFAYSMIFVFIVGTTATSFAAEKSLPGDFLYPIKTEINENIAKTLSFTQNQKAKTNVKLVGKRMNELAELVATEEDSPKKIDIIVEKLDEHKQDLVVAINSEKNDSDTSEKIEIYSELESIVDVHIDILEVIENDYKNENEGLEKETEINKEKIKNKEEIETNDNIQNAIEEAIEFSEEINPILKEAKEKSDTIVDEADLNNKKSEKKQEILNEMEHVLNIEISDFLDSE